MAGPVGQQRWRVKVHVSRRRPVRGCSVWRRVGWGGWVGLEAAKTLGRRVRGAVGKVGGWWWLKRWPGSRLHGVVVALKGLDGLG